MSKAVLLALFAIAILTQPLSGQTREELPASLFSWDGEREEMGQLPSITTDRPDFTEASSTVGLGVAQLEMGYTFIRSAGTSTHSWGEPLLRAGVLANWLELRAAVFPVTEVSQQTDSGLEDLYLGTKLWLTQQKGWLPEVSVVPQMTVPTGASAFTANRVLPGVNLLYGWDVTDDLSIGASTQYNRSVDEFRSAYDEWAQSVTFGRSFTDKVGSYAEWFAFFPSGNSSVSTEHFLDAGITYLWSENVQFDVRMGKGLTGSSDDYFAGLGLSIRRQ